MDGPVLFFSQSHHRSHVHTLYSTHTKLSGEVELEMMPVTKGQDEVYNACLSRDKGIYCTQEQGYRWMYPHLLYKIKTGTRFKQCAMMGYTHCHSDCQLVPLWCSAPKYDFCTSSTSVQRLPLSPPGVHHHWHGSPAFLHLLCRLQIHLITPTGNLVTDVYLQSVILCCIHKLRIDFK